MSFVTDALRTSEMGLNQNLQLLPDHPSTTELQQITVIITAHIIPNLLESITLISCSDLDLTRSPSPTN
jgi:hypothetical protein